MKIRQEINLIASGPFTITPTTTSTSGDIANLDTTKYTNPTYYFEVCGSCTFDITVALRRVGTTTDDASVTIPAGGVSLLRSAAFSPPAGSTDYCVQCDNSGTITSVVAARIIILDSGTITSTQTQIEIGSFTSGTNTTVADLTNPKFWTYTAANWDGTKTFAVEVVWKTSAKNTVTITLCRTSDNAANVTIVSAGSSSTAYVRTRVAFTPVNGETYKLRAVGSTTKSFFNTACGKIIVNQSASPTKLEPQFLLLNQADSNATGVQNYLAQWKSSEWDAEGGSITYKHAMDSDNASNSAKIRDVTDGADISNSTVTGSGQQVSSALGAFTDTNKLDCWVLNTTGVIAASRILAIYAWAAAASITLPEFVQAPLQPARYWH